MQVSMRWIINMQNLAFSIISLFDVEPFRPKFELSWAFEATETFKIYTCQKHTAGWCHSRTGCQACRHLLSLALYVQLSHCTRTQKAQNLDRVWGEQEFVEDKTMCMTGMSIDEERSSFVNSILYKQKQFSFTYMFRPIIEIHIRVIACYSWFLYCLLSQSK
jgi:hypothetical protein